MNSLYHEFSIGFNWYYIAAPAFAVAAFLIGRVTTKAKKTKYGKRVIKTLVAEKFCGYLAGLLTVITIIMLVVESGDGIMQTVNNGLRGTEDVYTSFAVIAFGSMFVDVVIWMLYRAVFLLGKKTKTKQLCHRYHLPLPTEYSSQKSPTQPKITVYTPDSQNTRRRY